MVRVARDREGVSGCRRPALWAWVFLAVVPTLSVVSNVPYVRTSSLPNAILFSPRCPFGS